ncbi:MAG: hypothetical protein E7563_03220 [Ruminococcaceae bacterium]|nr:hypothetical protein [Oscillospiraceae bacterium]
MTESMYLCAGSLCCTLVVCSLVRIIAPAGNTTKIMSLVISIFSLCCLFSSFISFSDNLKFIEADISQAEISDDVFSDLCDDKVLSTTGDYINSYTKNLLIQSDINPQQIITVMGVDKNRGIYIREMNIFINEKYHSKTDEVKETVSSILGIEPTITEI